MALINYQKFPGTLGTLTINAVDYPAATWSFAAHTEPILLRTASSMPFADVCPGNKTVVISATAPLSAFNPFRQVAPPYLNTFVSIRCVVLNGNTSAFCESALVTDWIYNNEAGGIGNWEYKAIGNFKFQNFAGVIE